MLVTDNFFFMYNNTKPSYMTKGEPELLQSLSQFKWAQAVQDAADSFISKHFGRDVFIAIHWRRG